MGFFDFLFGSKGEMKTEPALDESQKKLFELLSGQVAEGLENGIEGYDGNFVADPTKQQTQAMDTMSTALANMPNAPKLNINQTAGITSMPSGYQNTQVLPSNYTLTAMPEGYENTEAPTPDELDQQTLGQVKDTLGQLLSGQPSTNINPQATQNFFNTNIKQPMQQQFTEEILPQVSEQFEGAGTYWGGARADAESKATQDFSNSLARELANLQYQDEQARRGLAESAADRSLSALNPAMQQAGIGLDYGLQHAQLQGNLNSQQFQDLLAAASTQNQQESQQFQDYLNRAQTEGQLNSQQFRDMLAKSELQGNQQARAYQNYLQAQGMQHDMNIGQQQLANQMASGLYDMGQNQQQMQTQGLQAQYDDWLRTQDYNNPYMQLATGLIGMPTQTQYYQEGQQGILPGLIGGGLNILTGGLAGGLFG